MKRLIKLKINPEKLIKSEDLIVLRGGYGGCYECDDCDHVKLGTIYGFGLSQYEAVAACQKYYPMTCYAQEAVCN